MANLRYARTDLSGMSTDMSLDAGLRSFMLGVYNKMSAGLALSAILALISGSVEPIRSLIFGTPLIYLVTFSPLIILLGATFFMRNPSPTASGLVYWSVVSFLGIGMGALTIVYGGRPDGMALIAKAFFVTSAAFGGLSLWGYTTKKNLSGWGSFLIMGLIGLVIASVVNIFMRSDMMSFIISCLGVLIFSGLVAYDTQRLKHSYFAMGGDARSMAVATNFGALSLYLSFINLFQFILALMSGGRD